MYNIIKKRQQTLHEDKGGPPPEKGSGGKLSDAELYTHHKALAGHYRAIANEQKAGDSGGINPGAETDSFAGDEAAFAEGSPEEEADESPAFEKEEQAEALENPKEELGETPAEEKAEDTTEPSIGLDRHKGGSLRSSNKQGRPISAFDEMRKKKKKAF